ncbi:hypothetical protein [Streptomyces umbrinus]|uniref:hypothetical protein n=1 Tax=Streptomyces umbrinus TaxID=67370 RepID=UPI003C2E1E03
MKDLADRRRESLPRWRELVSAMTDEVDALVATFLERVDDIAGYRAGPVSEEQLQESAHSSLALILSAVATDSTTTQLSSLPGELGRLRARQGVPGEDLVAAVQLDFGVIWSAMLSRARDSDMAVLALHVENLWSVVDDYARAVQQSYLEERALWPPPRGTSSSPTSRSSSARPAGRPGTCRTSPAPWASTPMPPSPWSSPTRRPPIRPTAPPRSSARSESSSSF